MDWLSRNLLWFFTITWLIQLSSVYAGRRVDYEAELHWFEFNDIIFCQDQDRMITHLKERIDQKSNRRIKYKSSKPIKCIISNWNVMATLRLIGISPALLQ